MRGNFVQLANFLQEQFPDLVVQGENYPPPPFMELVSNLLTGAQMICLIWIVLGKQGFFRLLAMPVPLWADTIEQHSMQIGMLLFLLLPQFCARWTATGAFEIFLDGQAVFSKLDTGRFPTLPELLEPIQAAGLKQVAA